MSEIIFFNDAHMSPAAELLAERHRQDRITHSLLPYRFGEVDHALAALVALRKQRTGGIAAIENERLRGFLIGKAMETALLGRTVWFTPESYAVASDRSPELLRDLYAAQAEVWVDQGYFSHYAMVAAGSPLLEIWLRLGFAYQQAYALLDLEMVEIAPSVDSVEFRQARSEDAPALAAIAHLTAGHQTRSPVFAPAPPDYIDELRTGYAGLAGDGEAAATWLALHQGELVGVQAYFVDPPTDGNLLSNAGWVELASAATLPQLRGQGIGRALTARGLQWARDAGYQVCLTDWRVANLQASRFWPRRGFMPVYYRLERRIDPRVVWARV